MKKCFVISPIGLPDSPVREHADAVLEYIIEPALRDLEVEAVRADRFSEPGLITDQMIAAILNYDPDGCIPEGVELGRRAGSAARPRVAAHCGAGAGGRP